MITGDKGCVDGEFHISSMSKVRLLMKSAPETAVMFSDDTSTEEVLVLASRNSLFDSDSCGDATAQCHVCSLSSGIEDGNSVSLSFSVVVVSVFDGVVTSLKA